MKCPKCGYLGFETTDRCRNCGYDFSLAPFSPEPDLALRSADKNIEAQADFDLPGLARLPDNLNAGSLDLDRLFGSDTTPVAPTTPPDPAHPAHYLLDTPVSVPPPARRVVLPNTQVVDLPMPPRDEPVYVIDTPLPAETEDVAALALEAAAPIMEAAPVETLPVEPMLAADPSALPFDDTLHVPPP
ncbi:MAG: hypothetical protein ABI665_17125, partial [Vicinamibacterales bacterium]